MGARTLHLKDGSAAPGSRTCCGSDPSPQGHQAARQTLFPVPRPCLLTQPKARGRPGCIKGPRGHLARAPPACLRPPSSPPALPSHLLLPGPHPAPGKVLLSSSLGEAGSPYAPPTACRERTGHANRRPGRARDEWAHAACRGLERACHAVPSPLPPRCPNPVKENSQL